VTETPAMAPRQKWGLRRDVDAGEVGGGFWTPATAFNEKLITRLVEHAGMGFELESVSQAMTAIEESTVIAVAEPAASD